MTKLPGGFPARISRGSQGCLGGLWARWGDALQQTASDATIKRFLCCTFCRDMAVFVVRNISAVMCLLQYVYHNICAVIYLP